MKDYLSMEQSVKQFHQKYGHLVNTTPRTALDGIPRKIKDLRVKLISEEYEELIESLLTHDMEKIADGAADLIYVIIGTCVSYGIPIERIFREMHRSNMTKVYIKPVDEGSKYAGYNPKGKGFMPPDVIGILYNPSKQTLLETLHNDREFENE